jgi:hypothetical protein
MPRKRFEPAELILFICGIFNDALSTTRYKDVEESGRGLV